MLRKTFTFNRIKSKTNNEISNKFNYYQYNTNYKKYIFGASICWICAIIYENYYYTQKYIYDAPTAKKNKFNKYN
jgi:hypothetical protein